jgi:prepilin-type processing-associated H-X9-DG protein
LVEANQYRALTSIFAYVGDGPHASTTLNQIDRPSDQLMIYEGGLYGPSGYIDHAGAMGHGAPFMSSFESLWTTSEATHLDLANGSDCDNFTNNTWPEYSWQDVFAHPEYAKNGEMCGIYPRYRHNGMCNMLFCDGHVKAMRKGQLDFVANVYCHSEFPYTPW